MTSTPALDPPATGVHAPPGSTPIYVITYPERLPVAELEETIALAEQQLRHVLGPDAGILVLDQGATLAGPVWAWSGQPVGLDPKAGWCEYP